MMTAAAIYLAIGFGLAVWSSRYPNGGNPIAVMFAWPMFIIFSGDADDRFS